MPRKSPMMSAMACLEEAHKRWCALVNDEKVSAGHKRRMQAACKPLEKALATLKKCNAQKGGADMPAPGALDTGLVVSNSSGLALDSRDPLGANVMNNIRAPKHMPQPFSINDDPTLNLPTQGLDNGIKDNIVPPLGGYVHNFGTTAVATMAGGAKRKRATKKRT